MPSAGVLRIKSSALRRLLWAATASAPYSEKLFASTRSAMFSRALRKPSAWRLAMASGRLASSVNAWRACTRARSGRACASASLPFWFALACELEEACIEAEAGVGAWLEATCTGGICDGARSKTASTSSTCTVSPVAQKSSRTLPARGAQTSCSIFMASSTSINWPCCTASPGWTSS